MFSYRSYKQLPHNIKSIATQYCVRQLFIETGVKKISQLHALLLTFDDREMETTKEIKQGWWYKKYQGEPIGKTSRIEDLSILYPSCKRALLHPLWWLLGDSNWSEETQLANILLRLDSSVSKYFVFVDKNGVQMKNNAIYNERYAQKANDLDTLTALTTLYLYQKYHKDKVNISLEEKCFNLTVILACFEWFSLDRYKLFNALKTVFCQDLKIERKEAKVPYHFCEVATKSEFETLCYLYKSLIQHSTINESLKITVDSLFQDFPTLKQLNYLATSRLDSTN